MKINKCTLIPKGPIIFSCAATEAVEFPSDWGRGRKSAAQA